MSPPIRALGAVLLAAALQTFGASLATAASEIGAVFQRAYLGAAGIRAGGLREALYFGTAVYAEETVVTGTGASTALRFADGSKLQIGANSTVVLDRFVYDPDAGIADAAIGFAKGIFRFVSGDMPEDRLRLETPSATLVIRGTKFILAVDDAGRTDVWVIEGAVEAQPRAGAAATAHAGQSLVITPGAPGVLLIEGRSAPHDPAVANDASSLRPGGGASSSASGLGANPGSGRGGDGASRGGGKSGGSKGGGSSGGSGGSTKGN